MLLASLALVAGLGFGCKRTTHAPPPPDVTGPGAVATPANATPPKPLLPSDSPVVHGSVVIRYAGINKALLQPGQSFADYLRAIDLDSGQAMESGGPTTDVLVDLVVQPGAFTVQNFHGGPVSLLTGPGAPAYNDCLQSLRMTPAPQKPVAPPTAYYCTMTSDGRLAALSVSNYDPASTTVTIAYTVWDPAT